MSSPGARVGGRSTLHFSCTISGFAPFLASLLLVMASPGVVRGQAATQPATSPSAAEQAAKEVDQQEMIDGLLGQAEGAGLMGRILARMRRSYEQLAQKYDAGPVTQEVQRRIVDDLAKAIEEARRQIQQMPSSPQTQPSEKDRQPKPQQDKSAKPDANEPKPQPQDCNQAQAARPPGQKPASRDAGGRPDQVLRGGGIDESRRSWGNIPPRDRDEVVQGLSEEVIEKYKQQVNRYYEGLGSQE